MISSACVRVGQQLSWAEGWIRWQKLVVYPWTDTNKLKSDKTLAPIIIWISTGPSPTLTLRRPVTQITTNWPILRLRIRSGYDAISRLPDPMIDLNDLMRLTFPLHRRSNVFSLDGMYFLSRLCSSELGPCDWASVSDQMSPVSGPEPVTRSPQPHHGPDTDSRKPVIFSLMARTRVSRSVTVTPPTPGPGPPLTAQNVYGSANPGLIGKQKSCNVNKQTL